jgi:hypothetical protein
VIAVEKLMDSDLNCHELSVTPPKSGFNELCSSSIRFTHAFSPSTLSQPAITSFLTGKYPSEVGVRDNSFNFLSTRFDSLARLAKKESYRTSFFPAGAPLLRNSGLQQGFDYFEDAISISNKKYFRSADENIKLFLTWLKFSNEAFFSVIHLSDLNYTHQPTFNDFGEPRNLSTESQLEEIDSKLFYLISELKKAKRFDNTQILLVGLQGRNIYERPQTFEAVSTHSERVRIATLYKPAGKPRDLGLSWSVDQNVSLVDWFETLKESWLHLPAESPVGTANLQKINLSPSFSVHHELPENNRWILSESTWGPWRGLAPYSVAVRNGQSLIIDDGNVRLYSTLTDQLENAPLKLNESDELANSDLLKGLNLIQSQKIEGSPDPEITKKLGNFFKLLQGNSREELDDVIKSFETSTVSIRLGYFLARYEIKRQRWQNLLQLAKRLHIHDWQALAERNLGRHETPFEHPCLKTIDQNLWLQELDRHTCLDKRINALIDGLKNENDPSLGKKLAPFVYNETIFLRLYEQNWAQQLPWNISDQKNAQNFLWMEALSLPQLQKIKSLWLTDKSL